MLKNQRSLLKSWVIRIAKQQMFGCLNGNLSMTSYHARWFPGLKTCNIVREEKKKKKKKKRLC